MKKCDIVIPVWNEPELTRDCIETLKRHTYYPYRLIVVDNASLNETARYLEGLKKEFSDFLLIKNKTNLGFVKAVNQGMRSSSSPYILILNNDTLLTSGWLTSLIETVELGPRNIGIANPTSNVFGKSSADGKIGQWQELDSCKGFCMLIKREVTEKIGYFDEIYKVGYFEEKDFSRRAIEAGYTSIRAKASFVFHKDRASFDKLENREEIFRKNENIYNKRWGKTQNVAFVVKDASALDGRRGLIHKLLNQGDRVHIFFSKSALPVSLGDHIQIRYFPMADSFFGYKILFKLWERRRKKKIDLIFVEDENALKFLNRFDFLHKAEVKI